MARRRRHRGDQSNLFDGIEPAEPSQPGWKPDPDKVRRRLERILAEARAADMMPWDWSEQSLYRTIFPQLAGLLPENEAAQYCFQFEQEWERLKAA